MDFNPFEAHHLYWGALCIIIACLIPRSWLRDALIILGAMLMLDDIIQHAAECVSPINRIFVWLWHKIFGSWWPFNF